MRELESRRGSSMLLAGMRRRSRRRLADHDEGGEAERAAALSLTAGAFVPSAIDSHSARRGVTSPVLARRDDDSGGDSDGDDDDDSDGDSDSDGDENKKKKNKSKTNKNDGSDSDGEDEDDKRKNQGENSPTPPPPAVSPPPPPGPGPVGAPGDTPTPAPGIPPVGGGGGAGGEGGGAGTDSTTAAPPARESGTAPADDAPSSTEVDNEPSSTESGEPSISTTTSTVTKLHADGPSSTPLHTSSFPPVDSSKNVTPSATSTDGPPAASVTGGNAKKGFPLAAAGALGAVLSFLVVSAVIWGFWFCLKKRRRARARVQPEWDFGPGVGGAASPSLKRAPSMTLAGPGTSSESTITVSTFPQFISAHAEAGARGNPFAHPRDALERDPFASDSDVGALRRGDTKRTVSTMSV